MAITSISTPTGDIRIDSEVFTQYTRDSHEVLEKISEHKKDIKEFNQDFKDLVQMIVTDTKLDNKIVSKYLKALYAAGTREIKATGELFTTLDDILKG